MIIGLLHGLEDGSIIPLSAILLISFSAAILFDKGILYGGNLIGNSIK